MSLRQRLLVNVALVLVLSLCIGAFVLYWRASAKIQTELHSAFVVGEQVLEDGVKGLDGSPNPYQQLIGIIEQFNSGRHLRVALLDMNGGRIVQSHLEMPDDPAPEWFYKLFAGVPESARVPVPPAIQGYSAFLIETDPRNEVQEVWEDLGNTLLVMGILAGLVSGFIYWTVGRELRPLEQLSGALSLAAQRDFSTRLDEGGPRDLRAVTSGFNHMVAQLEEAEASKTVLEEQLSTVQEEERAELARDLHDEIGPLLFSVGLDAAAVQKALGEHAGRDVLERLESIREAVSLSQRRVLQILGRLRTGTVEDLGLAAAVQRLVEFWTSRHPNLKIDTVIPEGGVGAELDSVVYRIIQESISNAVRHGHTTAIDIKVSQDSGIRVRVVDDGGGLKSNRSGHGLTGMRERVASKRGVFVVRNSDDGKGTLVEANFPQFEFQIMTSEPLRADSRP